MTMTESTTTPPSQPAQSSSDSNTDDHSVYKSEVFFTGTRGFFSFPAEIRNQIMSLILTPGNIFLKPHPILGTSGPSKYHRKRYGCQFLATCRQAYNEGHRMYYSSNTFHLPSGRDHWARQLFDLVQPKHRSMIQYLAINCSIYDIHYPGPMDEIERAADDWLILDGGGGGPRDFGWRENMHRPSPFLPGFIETSTYQLCQAYCPPATETLLGLWVKKMKYVSRNFPGLKTLSVTFMEGANPWLFQYLGLEPKKSANRGDWKQEDEEQGLDQEAEEEEDDAHGGDGYPARNGYHLLRTDRDADQDGDEYGPGDYYYHIRSFELSRSDLAIAVKQMKKKVWYDRGPDLPIMKAAEEAIMAAKQSIEWEFSQLGRAGVSHQRREYILISKSDWATDRMNRKGPPWNPYLESSMGPHRKNRDGMW